MKSKSSGGIPLFCPAADWCAAAPAEPTATSPLASVWITTWMQQIPICSGNFYRFLPTKNFCYKFNHLKSLILYYDCDSGTFRPPLCRPRLYP